LTSPTAPRRSSPSTSGERCRLHSLLVASDPMPFRFRRQSSWLFSGDLAAFHGVFDFT
jgi:hypothetical protein